MLSRTIQVTLLAEIARYPYFLLLAFFLCASAISVLGESPTVFDWLDVPMAITALVGVFGFVFRMRIFRPGFWQAFMPALLAWEITYNLVLAWQMDLALRPLGEDLWAYLVVGLAFLAPMYVVLFLYAYRSQSIWAGQAGPKLPRFPLCDTERNTLDGARPVHAVDSVWPSAGPVELQFGLKFRPNYDLCLRGWTAGTRAFGDTDMGSDRQTPAPRLRFPLSSLCLHEIRSVVAWKPAPTSIGRTDLPWVRECARPPRQLEDVDTGNDVEHTAVRCMPLLDPESFPCLRVAPMRAFNSQDEST